MAPDAFLLPEEHEWIGHWLDIKGAAENPEINAAVTAQIKAMWAQIASRFKDKGQFLIFESFNEIHDGGWGVCVPFLFLR